MAKRQPSARARRPRVWVVETEAGRVPFITKTLADDLARYCRVELNIPARVVPYERVERGR